LALSQSQYTTAMSQSLDVIIAQRVKAALYDKDALMNYCNYTCKELYKCDFLTHFKQKYNTYCNIYCDINAYEFFQDHCEYIKCYSSMYYKSKGFYSIEEVTNPYYTDTIKIFKASIALIEDADENGIDAVIEAYTTSNWGMLTTLYINALLEELINHDNFELCQILKDYIQYETSKHLAIQKIKRNQLFNCGLGLKLSMKHCGIELTT